MNNVQGKRIPQLNEYNYNENPIPLNEILLPVALVHGTTSVTKNISLATLIDVVNKKSLLNEQVFDIKTLKSNFKALNTKFEEVTSLLNNKITELTDNTNSHITRINEANVQIENNINELSDHLNNEIDQLNESLTAVSESLDKLSSDFIDFVNTVNVNNSDTLVINDDMVCSIEFLDMGDQNNLEIKEN